MIETSCTARKSWISCCLPTPDVAYELIARIVHRGVDTADQNPSADPKLLDQYEWARGFFMECEWLGIMLRLNSSGRLK